METGREVAISYTISKDVARTLADVGVWPRIVRPKQWPGQTWMGRRYAAFGTKRPGVQISPPRPAQRPCPAPGYGLSHG